MCSPQNGAPAALPTAAWLVPREQYCTTARALRPPTHPLSPGTSRVAMQTTGFGVRLSARPAASNRPPNRRWHGINVLAATACDCSRQRRVPAVAAPPPTLPDSTAVGSNSCYCYTVPDVRLSPRPPRLHGRSQVQSGTPSAAASGGCLLLNHLLQRWLGGLLRTSEDSQHRGFRYDICRSAPTLCRQHRMHRAGASDNWLPWRVVSARDGSRRPRPRASPRRRARCSADGQKVLHLSPLPTANQSPPQHGFNALAHRRRCHPCGFLTPKQ